MDRQDEILGRLEATLLKLEAETEAHDKIIERADKIEDRVNKNADSIRILASDFKRIEDAIYAEHEANEPVREWLNDARSVGRFFRVTRAVVGWLALVLGAGSVTWLAVTDSVPG